MSEMPRRRALSTMGVGLVGAATAQALPPPNVRFHAHVWVRRYDPDTDSETTVDFDIYPEEPDQDSFEAVEAILANVVQQGVVHEFEWYPPTKVLRGAIKAGPIEGF